jgi:hypothetical protein
MFPLSRNFLKFAAASSLLALTASSTPARADEMIQNLGPVGPNAPILATVGSKNVIASYAPASGTCAIRVVVWDANDTDAASAARIRVSLNPGEAASIDSAENKSLTLKCGDYAESLAVVDTDQQVASEASK